MNYPHLIQRVFNTPLMIHDGKLQVILSVLGPRFDLTIPQLAEPSEDYRPSSRSEERRDLIEVIDVTGTLVNRMAMEPPSEMASYERIARRVDRAAADPDVAGILLRFESFGGEVNGAFDAADKIAAAAEEKPVYASVDDNAYSGAYLLASQAEKIFITRTGGVGSVGVIAIHYDFSQYLEKKGIAPTLIYAGARKADLYPDTPLPEEAAAWIRSEVNREYTTFVDYVARGRGMGVKAVRATEAGLYTGQAGIDVGFADEIGTFQVALAALVERAARKNSGGLSAKSQKEVHSMADTTAEAPQGQAAKPKEGTVIEMVPEPDLDRIRKDAKESGYNEAAEIVDLCILAGEAGKATEFIKNRTSVADVRKTLLATKAEQDEKTPTNSQIRGDEGTDSEQAKSKKEEASTPERMKSLVAERGLAKGGK